MLDCMQSFCEGACSWEAGSSDGRCVGVSVWVGVDL